MQWIFVELHTLIEIAAPSAAPSFAAAPSSLAAPPQQHDHPDDHAQHSAIMHTMIHSTITTVTITIIHSIPITPATAPLSATHG
jgi:hypothetical protein